MLVMKSVWGLGGGSGLKTMNIMTKSLSWEKRFKLRKGALRLCVGNPRIRASHSFSDLVNANVEEVWHTGGNETHLGHLGLFVFFLGNMNIQIPVGPQRSKSRR